MEELYIHPLYVFTSTLRLTYNRPSVSNKCKLAMGLPNNEHIECRHEEAGGPTGRPDYTGAKLHTVHRTCSLAC
jgi:hypothetical protein